MNPDLDQVQAQRTKNNNQYCNEDTARRSRNMGFFQLDNTLSDLPFYRNYSFQTARRSMEQSGHNWCHCLSSTLAILHLSTFLPIPFRLTFCILLCLRFVSGIGSLASLKVTPQSARLLQQHLRRKRRQRQAERRIREIAGFGGHTLARGCWAVM